MNAKQARAVLNRWREGYFPTTHELAIAWSTWLQRYGKPYRDFYPNVDDRDVLRDIANGLPD